MAVDVSDDRLQSRGLLPSGFLGHPRQRHIPSSNLVLPHDRYLCWLVSVRNKRCPNSLLNRTFTKAPYNWSSGDIGLLSLSGFIGGLFAFYLGGRLIDVISSRRTARHGGPRLPEHRLPAIIIPATIGPAGILIFGLCVAHKTHWIVPAFGYAMQAFGVAAISNVAVTYSLEMYKPVSSQTSQQTFF